MYLHSERERESMVSLGWAAVASVHIELVLIHNPFHIQSQNTEGKDRWSE